MKKRLIPFHCRFYQDEIEELETLAEQKKTSLSRIIRMTCTLGSQVIRYQAMMNDPERRAEFMEKMNQIIQNDQLDGWFETLTTEQLSGFLTYTQVELDKRHIQGKLR